MVRVTLARHMIEYLLKLTTWFAANNMGIPAVGHIYAFCFSGVIFLLGDICMYTQAYNPFITVKNLITI